jgi:ATP-dependent helicase/nuclease subunit B
MMLQWGIAAPLQRSNDPGPNRHFLGWDAPVLESTVAFLARDWSGEGLLDLSDQVVVVPTRQAGRRLREGLARHAATAEAAVLPPLVVTPNHLFSPARLPEGEGPVATPSRARLLWSALLQRLPLASFRRVFPVDPVEQSLKWAVDNAGELLAVRDLLIESGLDFRAAAEALGAEGIEPGRWQELASIEAAAVRLIEAAGFRDPGQASLAAAEHGKFPDGIRHLVVAAVSDLSPLAAKALLHQAARMPVTILVPAPASEAGAFDAFGRPVPSCWLEREIVFEDPEGTLHSCSNPAAQAERCLELLADYDDPAACAAIGLPDPEIAATLEHRFLPAGIRVYDPSGRPILREGIHHFLGLLEELVSGERYATFLQLLRCPGFASAMVSEEARGSLRSGLLLKDSDDLAREHLPEDLEAAAGALRRSPGRWGTLAAVVEGTRALLTRLRRDDFTRELCALLAEVFAGKRFSPHDPEAAVFSEVAEAIHELETDLAMTAAAFPSRPDAGERFLLLLRSLGERRTYPERGPKELDLQGWLELIWEDAPHLVVTGMNDHVVPEAVTGHAFLPDAARRILGVPDNEARFARDAFVLSLLLETRRAGGRLDLLFGRLDASGDPLRPSRLLFQCQDAELAARTLRLFHDEGGEARTPPARTVAWQLRPEPLPPDHPVFSRLSVTGFKSYLACPFRFYLKHGLRMEAVEPGLGELDAMDFGNLVHAALECLGRDEALARSTDAGEIADGFAEAVDRWLERRFGSRLPVPILIQREAARRRLAHWAAIEAAERAAGWEILEVESELGKDGHWPFTIDGLRVTGRIDRIERHPTEGLRVFDFKTLSPMENGRLKTVSQFHLTSVKRSDDPALLPDWSLTTDAKGKRLRWIDLQVPLYHLALASRFPGERIAAGYATLGRTLEEVRIDLWEGLDAGVLASAEACATGVVNAVRAGRFWPPNERMPEWDEFHALFSPTAEAAVDPSALNRA